MRAVVDTSVLIDERPLLGVEAAISVASLAELHFGVLVASEQGERARRTDRLAAVEAAFEPLPVTAEVARAWGRLASVIALQGGNPRRRQIDLVIAATALVEDVPLISLNVADLRMLGDVLDIRLP